MEIFKKKTKDLTNFDTSKLSNFHFGKADAQSDEVLTHCFQNINGVSEFLSGAKNIVLGERGAGKSALFKLISEDKIQFTSKKSSQRKDLIVPIEDDLNYISIAQAVDTRFTGKSVKTHSRYRFLWELYILDRIIKCLEDVNIDKDSEFDGLKKDIGKALGINHDKKSFFDTLKNLKVTAATKYDSVTNTITPSVSVEPSVNTQLKGVEISDTEIASISSRLRKFIHKKTDFVVIVLIDKIDDFVVGIEYEEQLKNIQALVECANDYRFPEIKVKLFLRSDLFNRLDFERIGYDKIYSQTTTLEWSKEDICEFVARRLVYNFIENEIPVNLNINFHSLDLDSELKSQLLSLSQNNENGLTEAVKKITERFKLKLKINWAIFNKTSHTARKTNLSQEISLKITTKIFPRRTYHFSLGCKKELLNLDDFFASHFKFGSDHPNPRLMLMFLNKVFELANRYYYKNSDLRMLSENSEHEYELILNDHINEAYQSIQNSSRKTIANLNSNWKRYIEHFFSTLEEPIKCSGFTIEDIKQRIQCDFDENELRRFIAFFSHAGLFIPENPHVSLESRKFGLPLLLKICPQ